MTHVTMEPAERKCYAEEAQGKNATVIREVDSLVGSSLPSQEFTPAAGNEMKRSQSRESTGWRRGTPKFGKSLLSALLSLFLFQEERGASKPTDFPFAPRNVVPK